ncbi:ATP-binding protein [Arthrobacter sp. ATA002]|uniref:BbrUII/HgiDII family restriction enzyme n=1 Tax=Arthrobacter sp. ATA002 TaxID=2991715 RepID=UPI0022A6BC21|nr:ATP-binding protein [Arthrobacter sp. ATA002]WAP51452.1 ATP-binding protein [Arthrobacter sp. ATA002]
MADPVFEMSLSLNVLNHLGINLYSNHPAVLSETVANAWDADATQISISLDVANESIVVQDNGIGMTVEDINTRFLRVGYRRREHKDTATTPSGRAVMGRKGIGKLALFSVAREILVETIRDGEKSALLMELEEINARIGGDDPSTTRPYHPKVMPVDTIDFQQGTRITLTGLKKSINKTAPHLRRRLARRFSVIGTQHNFAVTIGGEPLTVADRDLTGKSQYIWIYGSPEQQSEIQSTITHSPRTEIRASVIGPGMTVSGWIGTAVDTATLRDATGEDHLNRLPLMIRGKLAQEDILDSFNEVGIFKSYLFGELHADFLDEDDKDDIATSSRQNIVQDDERYRLLLEFIGSEIRRIKLLWTDYRNEEGVKTALEVAEIKDWFNTLGKDTKKKAQRLFGKINQLGLPEDDRNEVFAQGVLAFEIMRQKDNLDALDSVSAQDMISLGKVLNTSADLEAALYHKIVASRLAIIEKLNQLVTANQKEKFLQDHIFEHLWLLDPGWERASSPTMEQSMQKAFKEVEGKLTKPERESRYDIRYQKTSGQHVIIELKRAGVITDTDSLSAQVKKYRKALTLWLENQNRGDEPHAVICVVGRELRDWSDPNGRRESADQLHAINTRVVMYDELLVNARNSYEDFLKESEGIGRVQKILNALVPVVDN